MRCKYCAQDVIIKNHGHMGYMTLEQFKKYLSTVPTSEVIIIGGIAEPFLFPDTVEMIEYAHEKGYHLQLFTTLVNLKPADAKRLVKIPFDNVVLHLPDAEGNAKIPATQDYYESLYIFLTNVRNHNVMDMGRNFVSDRNEDVLRGIPTIHHTGRITCPKLESPVYMIFPNGMVSLCCTLRGVEGYIGNLNDTTYPELLARFNDISKRYQKDPNTMCHRCSIAEIYWLYHAKKPLSDFLKDLRIVRLRNRLRIFPISEQLSIDNSLKRVL